MRPALLLVTGLVVASPPPGASAQFSSPCGATCAAVLGATAFVTATGSSITVGRITGGMTSVNDGLAVWGTSFAVVVAGGIAFSGDGAQQERVVYSAGVGTLAGAATGMVVEALRTRGDPPGVFAGTMIGATVGTLAGGVYGALTFDGDDDGGGAIPLFNLSLRF